MKRALRNTETAMFLKSDGGETDSIQTARFFVSYDDAVAFCRERKLGTVELVVHSDDEPEYALAISARHLTGADDDEKATSSEAESGEREAPAETLDEFGFPRSMMPESDVLEEPCACDQEVGLAAPVHEIDLGSDGCCRDAVGEEAELDGGQAEAVAMAWEIALSMYAEPEQASHAPEYHFSPPCKCDVCGVALIERSFFVDGRVGESGEWRDMCSQCFFLGGAKIGPGRGQLYQRQTDGRWLLVAGFGDRLGNEPQGGGAENGQAIDYENPAGKAPPGWNT